MSTARRAIVMMVGAVAGCTQYLPPPAIPNQIVPVPVVKLGPPAQGDGTVLIDADRPAEVEEVTGRIATYYGGRDARMGIGIETRPVCVTPCEAHLAQGSHELVFSADGAWGGRARIEVGPEPTAFRYALGHRDTNFGSRLGGAFALSFGLVGVGVGIPFWLSSNSSLSSAGEYITIPSIGLTVLGAVLLAIYHPELQDGAGVQWTLPSGAPGAR